MLKRLFQFKKIYYNRIEYYNIWGQFHRTDGPARESINGSKQWYLNGKLHRTDGPAIEYSNGIKEWYLEGKKLSEQEFNSQSKMTKYRDRKEWTNPIGQLHRTDGPAIEYSDGSKEWYLNSQRHRTDGPAIEYSSGRKDWYLNGQFHRTDGPACEWSNGTKFWYLNGQKHRENGPAIEWSDGKKEWYLNGQRHRENGPAVEQLNGSKYWYLNGKELSEEKFMEKITSKIIAYYDNTSIIYFWHSQCPPSAPLLHEIDIPYPTYPTAPPLEE